MRASLLLLTLILVISCKSDSSEVIDNETNDTDTTSQTTGSEALDTANIESEYDMSTVDGKDKREFIETLAKIEKEHGVQWDFCRCVVVNDSLNKAVKDPNADLDEILTRMDEVEEKCKAFLAQNPDRTPEERIRHEKKVKKCLKAAGVIK